MRRTPGIRRIAELAHVSVATVSRVINGKSGVDEATRALVWQAIQEAGYDVVRHPDALSAILVFGPLTSFRDNAYWCLVVSGLLHEASLLSIPVMFSTSKSRAQAQSEIRSLSARDGVLGVILVGFPLNASAKEWTLHRPDVATVSILMDGPGHTVNTDLYTAFYDATVRLYSLGHRRIALAINGWAYWPPQQRLQGYLDACASLGLTPRVGKLAPTMKAAAWLREMLEDPDPPTAIIGGTSDLSKQLFAELVHLKVRMPDDLSFLGISHGLPFNLDMFDSVVQPTFDLGVHAVRVLRQVVARPKRPPVRLSLPCSLVSAGTVGPPPQ